MKLKREFFLELGLSFIIFISTVAVVNGESLFKGREIYLNKDENSSFRIGVTGTTAGYNYIALIEGAKQESISLGDLGYWESVNDPPSSLRNYDLQLLIENNHKGSFQIEFKYNPNLKNLEYLVKEGAIEIDLDNSDYYPKLIISSVATVEQMIKEGIIGKGSDSLVFFDFNSFDVDLRRYYGSIKRLLESSDSNHYFYYYESADYNSYYFKTFQEVAELDTDKMGLSLEDGTLEYYQKILDNLKSRFGASFTKRLIIVSRFGNRFSKELREYAFEVGLGRDMEFIFWSYDQIK